MAVTATLLNANPYMLTYELDYDGVGQADFVITNAVLQADAAASVRLLPDVLQQSVADDAAAQLLMFAVPCTTALLNTGAGALPRTWSIAAEADGGNLPQLHVRAENGIASTAILSMNCRQSSS
jgi:hypothetical protein